MEKRDVARFVAAFLAVMLVLKILSLVIGHRLDEFDYMHAIIIAAMSTVIRAIREPSA